jgi:hypothetical protein
LRLEGAVEVGHEDCGALIVRDDEVVDAIARQVPHRQGIRVRMDGQAEIGGIEQR